MSHGLLETLWLPIDRDLVDVLLPEGHLTTGGKSNEIPQAISVLSNTPESPVLHLSDLEVYRFGAFVRGLDDDASDAINAEVLGHLARYDVAGPVCSFVHGDWLEVSRHDSNTETVLQDFSQGPR